MRVYDWMSPDPVTIEPTTEIDVAARLLHDYGIRHLPVVDRGRVVGVVSDRDVHGRQPAPAEPEDESGASPAPMVEAIMSTPAHVIGADESVEAAARYMLSRRISALPVLDDGLLVGVITTTDCLLASLTPPAATPLPAAALLSAW